MWYNFNTSRICLVWETDEYKRKNAVYIVPGTEETPFENMLPTVQLRMSPITGRYTSPFIYQGVYFGLPVTFLLSNYSLYICKYSYARSYFAWKVTLRE